MKTLRPYQARCVEFCASRQTAFVEAPAGSGKTIIGANIAAAVASPFDLVVWLANTREQVQQAHDAIKATHWPVPVVTQVGCVAGKLDTSNADILILDESHHLPAATWTQKAICARGRVYGLSATPWCGDWERDESLKAFFGADNFIKISRDEVKKFGAITDGRVFIHDLDIPEQFQKEIEDTASALVAMRRNRFRFVQVHELMRRALWEVTVEKVRTNSVRNARIVSLAKEGEGVIVLVGSIEHGQMLVESIGDAVLVHSRMGAKKRREAIAAAKAGDLRCMVSTSLADEGLDVPRLATLINAVGGRSAGKLEQRAGRVMRPHESKTIGTVHDFADKGARLAHSQFKARCRTYKKLGYSIKDYGHGLN